MINFNISSFLRLMQTGLVENSTQEATGRLLLESIEVDGGSPDINAKMITNLVKQNNDVLEIIKKASARPEVVTNAIHYFEDIVVPDLNPHLKDDICSNIINLLEKDSSVPKKKCEELMALYQDDKTGELLARSFLYAMSRANKRDVLEKAQMLRNEPEEKPSLSQSVTNLSTEQIPQLEIQIVVLGFGSTPNVTHATLTKHNEKQISTDYKLEVKAMIK